MKLRIRGNMVRIRLTQSEVARLAAGSRVEQTTTFSAISKLVSSVETSGATQAAVKFDGADLAVILPADRVCHWAASDDVSIDETQAVGAGQSLRLLIEKDFECMHSRAEMDTDAFPNPRKIER
jgi:hypothetical protein